MNFSFSSRSKRILFHRYKGLAFPPPLWYNGFILFSLRQRGFLADRFTAGGLIRMFLQAVFPRGGGTPDNHDRKRGRIWKNETSVC